LTSALGKPDHDAKQYNGSTIVEQAFAFQDDLQPFLDVHLAE
jgi:hypothetical protein